jgi:hypothetical protein
MNDTKRIAGIILASLAALCLASVAIFAARNWSNPPVSIGSDDLDAPYSIVAPDGWKTTPSTDATRDESGVRTCEWIASPSANGVSVAVKDAMKDGKTFEEIAGGFVWTSDDVARLVALMKEETGDLYKDFSETDVLISSGADTINGASAVRAIQQCLKPCYVEGAAATTVRYIVDALDRVYILEITTGTGTNTAALLNEADAVVRTFKAE